MPGLILMDMDNMRNGNMVSYTPNDIDPDGLKILIDAGFIWDSRLLAFQRSRSVIEYGFLRDQRLVVNSTLSRDERVGQLQRLRILIQSMD
jgi:hypothetical protein